MMAVHLVLIPGHAVWSGRGDPLDSGTWFLKPFQNRVPALLAHRGPEIQAGPPPWDSRVG
ncbi:MAG: hypothetical protein ABSC08_15880 [Bryobacteraceae bacterium]|jgi:hypothetical protein